jgi:hypothetical protein
MNNRSKTSFVFFALTVKLGFLLHHNPLHHSTPLQILPALLHYLCFAQRLQLPMAFSMVKLAFVLDHEWEHRRALLLAPFE